MKWIGVAALMGLLFIIGVRALFFKRDKTEFGKKIIRK
jgi:hypothetical protein